jgi:hypothetical protein
MDTPLAASSIIDSEVETDALLDAIDATDERNSALTRPPTRLE